MKENLNSLEGLYPIALDLKQTNLNLQLKK